VVAHFNHRLRGAESDADQEFVLRLCHDLGVSSEIGTRGAERPESAGDGVEAAAREDRYQFLTEVAHARGARYVATAHTSDDQAETILHRVLRGTGIAGLAGIRRARPLSDAVTLIRPLLFARRTEIEAYLGELGQPWREDGSNRDPRFTRNRIRRDLLPKLAAEHNPGIVDALLRLGLQAADAQRLIEAAAEAVAQNAVRSSGSSVTIDCDRLAGVDRALVREVLALTWRERGWPLQGMGYAEWEELADMALANKIAAKRLFPGRVEASRREAMLTLSRGA
jgi:tRNA(Ile)-lysidine synthase